MIERSFDHDDNSQMKFSWLLVVASNLRELALLPANIFWNTPFQSDPPFHIVSKKPHKVQKDLVLDFVKLY